MMRREAHQVVKQIIRDAGGELVGRTRLQKVAYLMHLAGFGDDLSFEYRSYGPFSEDLARGIEIATAFGDVTEREQETTWGGRYSIFQVKDISTDRPDPVRAAFVEAAKRVNSIELELAATAAFLCVAKSQSNPWTETQRLKPDKASNGRLERAMKAYEALRMVKTPKALPALPAH